MSVSSIAVPSDPKRDARAMELVDSVGSWPRYTLKVAWGGFEAGTVFRRAYGSNGARYLVNAVACQCPDYQQRGAVCKHIRAFVLWTARQAATSRPAPRLTAEDLFPKCRTCSDLVDRRGESCYRCASDEAHRLEIARRRELVTA